MYFVGIDLAWSNKNPSGMALLEGSHHQAKVLTADLVGSNTEIISYLKNTVKNRSALVAIDAPLVVPNLKGRRIAEVLVGNLFRKYNAGAHPANRERLSQWSGDIRGETISNLLENEGFDHNPQLIKFEQSRKFFEVYPHPSMVALFKLTKIIQYKAKPKRDYAFRYAEFKKYQILLTSLKQAKPSLLLPKEISHQEVVGLKGKALKNFEDTLDAIFCAYIAYYYWAKPENCAILGNLKQGYILTPILESMKGQLRCD